MTVEPHERIFLYLRLRAGDDVLVRTKIREFAGLAGLMVELQRLMISGEVPVLEPDGPRVLEYVDAQGDQVLIAIGADLAPDRPGHWIRGRIPADYRARMLDPQASSFSSGKLAERAGDDPRLQEAVSDMLEQAEQSPDVLALIRSAIDDEGRFEVRLPESGLG